MKVYIELVVLNNFALGFLLIHLSSRISGVRVSLRRLFLGAAVNGLGSAAVFAAGGGLVLRAAVLIAIYFSSAFSRVWPKRTLNFLGAFFVVNALFTGCLFLLISITGDAYILRGGVVVTGAAAGLIPPVIIGGTAAAGLIRREICRRRMTEELVRLTITSGERVEITVLLDTGNRVRTITGLPALFVDREVYGAFDSGRRPCVAGCVTVTGKKTVTGFVPERVTAQIMGREKEISAAVFPSDTPIDGGYRGILNPQAVIYF